MSRDKTVAVFGSSQTVPDSQQWADAEKVGTRCAVSGLAVVTGGYGGTMEAASRGAALAGGMVIGVTAPALFATRTGANPHVTQVIEAETLSARIGILTELADAAIVLPGSIGTAAELVVVWNLNHIVRRNGGTRLPTVAVGEDWRVFSKLLADRLGAFAADVHTVGTVDEAVDWVLAQPEIG